MLILPPLPRALASSRIPPTLHQIWVGSPVPDWVSARWEQWDQHMAEQAASWTVHRWTDEQSPNRALTAFVAQYTDQHGLSARTAADILRLYAVGTMGGVYADSDTVPLRPLAHLASEATAPWVGIVPPHSPGRINNHCFGLPPAHPLLQAVLDHGEQAVRRGVRDDFHTFGTAAWGRAYGTLRQDQQPRLVGTFENRTETQLQRAARDGQHIDPAPWRERFPQCPIMHITFTAERQQ